MSRTHPPSNRKENTMYYKNTLKNYKHLVENFYDNNPLIFFNMPDNVAPIKHNKEKFYFTITWERNTIVIDGTDDLFVELLDIFRDYIEDNSLDIRRFQENEVVFNLNTTSIRKEFDQVRIALMEDYHAKYITANAQTDKALDMLFSLYER